MSEPVFHGSNRIVLDWDGTLVPQAWPESPPLMEGAHEALEAFLGAGYELVVSSTRLAPRAMDEVTPLVRADKEREARYIRRTLDQAGLERVHIWRRPWKPGALFYVDDKAVEFRDNWAEVTERILLSGAGS